MNQTQPKPYPPQTAGRLMTDKVPVVKDDAHIADVENLLFKETANFETINLSVFVYFSIASWLL